MARYRGGRVGGGVGGWEGGGVGGGTGWVAEGGLYLPLGHRPQCRVLSK